MDEENVYNYICNASKQTNKTNKKRAEIQNNIPFELRNKLYKSQTDCIHNRNNQQQSNAHNYRNFQSCCAVICTGY